MNCMYCGKPLKSNGTCDCWQSLSKDLSESMMQSPIIQIFEFAYQCPNCHGKFNEPAYKSSKNTACSVHYHWECPFCGMEMIGLKGVE